MDLMPYRVCWLAAGLIAILAFALLAVNAFAA